MNFSSLPVTTGGRYERRRQIICRIVQGLAIDFCTKFEASTIKYVGMRAFRIYMASTETVAKLRGMPEANPIELQTCGVQLKLS